MKQCRRLFGAWPRAAVFLALSHAFSSGNAFSVMPLNGISINKYKEVGISLAMMPPVTQEEVDVNNESTNGDDDDIMSSSAIPVEISSPPISRRKLPSNWLGEKLYILSTAALIGLLTGSNIACFKTAVEFVREALYGDGVELLRGSDILLRISEMLPLWLIPAVGGILVGLLLSIGDMPPGLRDTVKEVDLDSIRATNATPPDELIMCTNLPPASQRNDFGRFSRKAIAATVTLGTGNSLGPEGPSVEAGMSLSRLLMTNKFFEKLSWVFGTLEDLDLDEVQRVNRKVAR
jgi:hypothetical protein